MPPYDLTKDAAQDLREVARYTLSKWGREALTQYRDGLKDTFKAIAFGEVQNRNFSQRFPDLLVTTYRYHYIFYFSENRLRPLIIGIIHER
jgi:toxin ParE1/3/4